jgi:xanthine dehydrogenase accessory factor
MIVLMDGTTIDTLGGGGLEKRVTEDSLEALGKGSSTLKTYGLRPEEKGGIGSECGGDAKVFIEIRGNSPRLVIFGGGHVGSAIARSAVPLGFTLTVIDARDDFASPERFPPGTDVVHADPTVSETSQRVPEGAFVVILTHSHDIDQKALSHVISRRPVYVGMIGSHRKVKVIMGNLVQAGIDPAVLKEVFSPVGLDIGAETPEEIALSILAEIVHVRRKGGSSPASLSARPRS